jgi:hypothetical protein
VVGVLDERELTELVTSIDGLIAVGAAAILAETGDPARFRSPRAVVKHSCRECAFPVGVQEWDGVRVELAWPRNVWSPADQ